MKAVREYGAGAVLERISRNDGRFAPPCCDIVILLGRCELDEEVVLIFSSSLLSVLDEGDGSRDEIERSNEGGRRENLRTDMLLLPHAS